MPKLTQQVLVEVKDKGTAGGKRTLDVAVSASAELFTLSDLLVKEGAIRELNFVLKCSARRAIAEYISSGRSFVKEVSAGKRKTSQRMEE